MKGKNCNPKKSYPCGASCQSNSYGGSCDQKFSGEISDGFLQLKENGNDNEIGKRKSFAKAKADLIRKRLIDKGDISEEDAQIAEKDMKNAFENSSTYVAVPEESLKKILKEGRFKTMFEVKNDREEDVSLDERMEIEEDLWGINSNPEYKPNQRPVYGYRGLFHENSEVEMYGDTKVRLKKSRDKDSTFVVGDSIATETASPLDNPSFGAMYTGSSRKFFQQPRNIPPDPNKWTVNYTEVQVHGGVSTEDIEAIMIPKGREIPQEIKESGINIEYY